MNYLIWKGNDSRNIKGLVISELPPISKPRMRAVETLVDGVDGSLIEEVGYEPYDRPVIIGMTSNADIDEVIRYFSGEGEVVFSNESDKYYKAKILEQIDFARLGRFRTAQVLFRVQPFKYQYQEARSNLWLNAKGGKNLLNPLKPTSANGVNVAYDKNNSILSLTSQGTSSRYTAMYNIEAEQGETVTFSAKLLDENCHVAMQEYTSDFVQVQQVYGDYENAEQTITISLTKKRADTRLRIVLYTSFEVPTGEITARYRCPMLTVNNADTTFDAYPVDDTVAVNAIKSFRVTNSGNYTSSPVIEIKGTGTVTFAFNDDELFRYTFPEKEDTVIIDSQQQDAYLGAVLKNRNMSGEFPVLPIGETDMTWEGVVSKLSISSRSRWL